MKTIFLVRHAKAEEKTPPERDYTRALTKKGIADAERLGKWLSGKKILPDRIISSPASRALQTAQIVRESIGFQEEIIPDENMYCDSSYNLIAVIRNIPAELNSVMLVGHN